ncbi:hypothetical protein Hypma_015944 [Hypsizygus marmoreus]|uniref:Protein kinase domain-containing protein n=1 Tax=Hypsizygus marmoreus TaxID=39966 RepID=A0A369K4X1_HYPMA|nr:hypothetical protein Hypma_015944 [Hypsizygus marmoreus]
MGRQCGRSLWHPSVTGPLLASWPFGVMNELADDVEQCSTKEATLACFDLATGGTLSSRGRRLLTMSKMFHCPFLYILSTSAFQPLFTVTLTLLPSHLQTPLPADIIMATLQLIWDHRSYDMWTWSMENTHQTAHIMKRIKNNVYLAHLGPLGAEPTHAVVVKVAQSPREMHALMTETEFYMNDLVHLQGTVVPRCYGFFKGKVDGNEIACLLLEYCAGFAPRNHKEKVEENRAKMVAACKIHQIGISHGDLVRGRHFVKLGDDVRIIDFSIAVRHRCPGALPILRDSRACHAIEQCRELALMEEMCGFKGENPNPFCNLM